MGRVTSGRNSRSTFVPAFVPKLIALAALILLLTPWLLRALTEFTVTTLTRMGGLGH